MFRNAVHKGVHSAAVVYGVGAGLTMYGGSVAIGAWRHLSSLATVYVEVGSREKRYSYMRHVANHAIYGVDNALKRADRHLASRLAPVAEKNVKPSVEELRNVKKVISGL